MRIVLISFIFYCLTSLFSIGAFADQPTGDRTILEGVTFDKESTVLEKTAIPSLQPLLEQMQSDPSLRMTIESYVDATTEPDKDLQLTRRRSQAIFNWFVAQGVEASRIDPVGYGSTRPLVERKTKDETVNNDRIEIVKSRSGYPVAEFLSIRHEFEPIVDGMEVRHDFVVRNTGTAELHIKEVKTGWGCTAVSFSRQIPPGGEGKIAIKVNTTGYGGKLLHKTIRVLTNDPRRAETQLSISGPVKVFATITPQNVKLFGTIGAAVKETVKIVPEDSYPFKIIDTEAQIGKEIRYHVSEDKQSRQTAYLLTVENLKQTTGRFYDTIYLTTDSRIKPKISIRVYGKISEPTSPKAN